MSNAVSYCSSTPGAGQCEVSLCSWWDGSDRTLHHFPGRVGVRARNNNLSEDMGRMKNWLKLIGAWYFNWTVGVPLNLSCTLPPRPHALHFLSFADGKKPAPQRALILHILSMYTQMGWWGVGGPSQIIDFISAGLLGDLKETTESGGANGLCLICVTTGSYWQGFSLSLSAFYITLFPPENHWGQTVSGVAVAQS